VIGSCPDCGRTEVVPIDDGEVVWVECATCTRTVRAYGHADCPTPLLLAAERLTDHDG
jgi:hypothetical protein